MVVGRVEALAAQLVVAAQLMKREELE